MAKDLQDPAQREAFDRHWASLAVAVGLPPEAGVKAGTFAISLDQTMKHIDFHPADTSVTTDWYKAAISRAPADVTRNVDLQMSLFARESPGHALLASAALDTIFEGHRLGEALRPPEAPPLDTARQVIERIQRDMIEQPQRTAGDIDLGPVPEPMKWDTASMPEHPSAAMVERDAQRELAAERADDREDRQDRGPDIDLGRAPEPMKWDTASMPEHPSAEVIDIQARRELAAELTDDQDRVAEPGRDRASSADEERTISPVFEREADKAPETGERPQADAERPGNDERQEPAAEPLKDDAPKDKAAAFSVEKGDVPEALRNRYLIEADRLGGDVRFYTDAKSDTPAFKDSGAKLVTRETNSAIISDMVATAVHRGWSEIKVTGEPEFKRQVWMEASLKGLEVSGFKPTERDKQELEKLLDARDGRSIEPARDRSQTQAGQDRQEGQNAGRGDASDKPSAPQRPDFDKGVSGVLVETGSAPYKHDAKNEASAYVVVETSPGQKTEIWGVGLPDALKRGGAEIGDTVNVRRDGTEIVQKTVQTKDERTGETRPEVKDVPRNRWEVTAERFREASPAEAARDPATREAQSTLKVIETALAERVPDKGLRDKLMSVAKEHIASKLASGGTFKEARVRETMRKDPTPRNQRAVTKTTQRTDDKKRSQDARTNKAVATKAVKAAEKQDDKSKVRKNPERSRTR